MLTYGQVVAQMAPGRCGIVVNTPMRARSSTHLVVGSIPPPVILSFDLLPLFPHLVLPHSSPSPFGHFPIGMSQDACAHVSSPHASVSLTAWCMSHSHAVCTACSSYIDWGRAGDGPHRLIPCPTRLQVMYSALLVMTSTYPLSYSPPAC